VKPSKVAEDRHDPRTEAIDELRAERPCFVLARDDRVSQLKERVTKTLCGTDQAMLEEVVRDFEEVIGAGEFVEAISAVRAHHFDLLNASDPKIAKLAGEHADQEDTD